MSSTQRVTLILLLCLLALAGRSQDIKFERLSSYQGLKSRIVRAIVQDDHGFMWFGTQNGMYRYDGYQFKGYFHDPQDSCSINYNWIHALCKDNAGNLWVGTYGGGLNKFDIEREIFISYQHDETNPKSLCDNYIIKLFADESDNLWIATQKGLSRLLHAEMQVPANQARFGNYRHDKTDHHSLSHPFVWSIYQSEDRTIWIGTQDGTLHKYDQAREQFNRVLSAEDVHRISETEQDSRIEYGLVFIGHNPLDQSKILTLGSNRGIFRYDYQKDQILKSQAGIYYNVIKKNDRNIINYLIGHNGLIWAIANNDGLYTIEQKTGDVSHYTNRSGYPFSLDTKNISTLYQDRQGIIWIGTLSGSGIQKYNQRSQSYVYYPIIEDTTGYSVTSIFEDQSADPPLLWLGTFSQGLIEYDQHKRQVMRVFSEINYPITAIGQSALKPDLLWMATMKGGLYCYDKVNHSLKNYLYHSPVDYFIDDPQRTDLKSTAYLTSLYPDANGHLWLGSLWGLHCFDPEKNEYISYTNNPKDSLTISANDISAICPGMDGADSVLWIGTRSGGLNKFDRKRKEFLRFKHDPDDPETLNANYVSSIHQDQSGLLWVGTPRGLNRLDRRTGRFERIIDNQQKLNTEIQCIISDRSGNLWLNTSYGFHKYNPETNESTTYANKFSRWAYFQNKTDDIFMGGYARVIRFNPDQIKENRYQAPVVLTDFRLFNEAVQITPGRTGPLQKSLAEAEEITLSYDQSVFSFEFSILDYSDPSQNKYAYMMEGVDPDWVYTDASRRYVTYTQLDPGEYLFRVKGSNSDGIWNEAGTSLKLVITPPWWRTNSAYLIYTALLIAIVVTVWRFQTGRLKMKQKLEMEQFEAQKLREVDQLKSRFFANISHEFRTPLTLIKGPVRQILDGDFKGNLKEQCQMILRNSDRLLALINQLLDLSKLESGNMSLKVTKMDLAQVVKGLVLSFAPLADRKNTVFKLEAADIPLNGYADRDILEKVVSNLLSNAFKFTPEGGEILVRMNMGVALPGKFANSIKAFDWNASPQQIPIPNSQFPIPDSGYVVITVSNSGPGIPADKLDRIFDRFYQMDLNYQKDTEGSGIGLALTRELVQLHHGKITVKSIPNKHTTFTITLPLDKAQYNEDEIAADASSEKQESYSEKITSDNFYPETDTPEKKSTLRPAASVSHPETSILIVEDNLDVTSYIRSFLEKEFRIFSALNGQSGLKMTLDKHPDLVISDVMMPQMDGFELCQKIKSDQRISHIPLILLTARADSDSKIGGLEFGADDYVTKPFEARELRIRVKNLITQRRKLREKFSSLIDLNPSDIAASSMDEQFLQRLLAVFEDHIEEADFNLEHLSREVGMSRTHLNRKIQALTNLSSRDLIRTIRLQKAARLLRSAAGTVSEIAFKVGFNNLSYFSRAFRQHFGQLPSDFSDKQ